LKKAFAYQQGNVAIEHKISQFRGKKKFVNNKNAAITADFGTR